MKINVHITTVISGNIRPDISTDNKPVGQYGFIFIQQKVDKPVSSLLVNTVSGIYAAICSQEWIY